MIYIIDRIEGDIVVLEDERGDISYHKRDMFQANISEGDAVKLVGGIFTIDMYITEEKRKQAHALLDDLWE